ncbi:unnamed protein product, partial [Citrullus colocynthis]
MAYHLSTAPVWRYPRSPDKPMGGEASLTREYDGRFTSGWARLRCHTSVPLCKDSNP